MTSFPLGVDVVIIVVEGYGVHGGCNVGIKWNELVRDLVPS